MQNCLIAWVLLWIVVPATPAAALDGVKVVEPSAAVSAAPTIKQTPACPIVYLIHRGAYWTIGPAIVQVREYMRTHEQQGDLFVRYSRNPASAGAGTIETQVGFMVEGDHQASPPLTNGHRPSERVASLVIEGRMPSIRHDYAKMAEWIDSQGLGASGPVIELYHAQSEGNRLRRIERTEIQFCLGPDSSVDASTAPQTAGARPAGESSTQRSVEGEPEAERATEDEQPAAVATPQPNDQPPASPLPVEAPPQAERIDLEPTAALIAAKRYDRIAELLLPAEVTDPPELRVWLGQMIYRIRAAATGVERQNPGVIQDLTPMADALLSRYQQSNASKRNALSYSALATGAGGAALVERQRGLMRELDELLGLVAVRGITPERMLDRLAEIIDGIRGVTCSVRGTQSAVSGSD